MEKIILSLILALLLCFSFVLAMESNLQVSVRVRLAGDVNNDCIVNIFDLASVGLAYGSTLDDNNWNANADLNNDGVVNIFDLAIVGINYRRGC
jgi:hypothetical protein